MEKITNTELTKKLSIAKRFAKGATISKDRNKISIDGRGIQGTNGMIGVIIPNETGYIYRREVFYNKGEYSTSSVSIGNTMDLYSILESMQVQKKYDQYFTVNRKDFIVKLKEMKAKKPLNNQVRIEIDCDGKLILKGADPDESFECIHRDEIPAEMKVHHDVVVLGLNIDYALATCNSVASRDVKFQFITVKGNHVNRALYITEENGNQYILMPVYYGIN